MKKIAIMIIGAILIAVLAVFVGWQYMSIKKKEYREQLENIINNNYLEGEYSIGAFYYDNEWKWHNHNEDSTSINKVSEFKFDQISWLFVNRASVWGNQYFDNTEIITKMLRSGIYKWYDFKYCTTNHPFMIIVKKTSRGYDIIGEYILGIGLTESYPDYLITQEPHYYNLRLFPNIKDKIYYSYKIKTDMISSYFEYLLNDKYDGITVRKEVTKDNDSEKNPKFEMLNNLVMKMACPADSSLYFRVNKYFELKYDNSFTTMGSNPAVWSTSSYGNHFQTVFTRTVTLHYSIQENKGLLENDFKKTIILLVIIAELLYLILVVLYLRKKKVRMD